MAASSPEPPAFDGGGLAARLTSPVLVGREKELSVLVEAAAEAPSIVTIEGEAGVGKSRLVSELLAAEALKAHTRLLGHCHETSEPFPLGPVVEALRVVGPRLPALSFSPLAGALRSLLPELTHRLPEPPEPLEDKAGERHRLFRALAEVLVVLGPTVLVLEDLHLSDRGTLDLLRYLTSQPPPGLALVLTYRREEVPSRSPLLGLGAQLPADLSQTRLTLRPLDVAEVQDLVCAILDTPDVSEEFATYLHARTDGLPFAVEEVLRLLVHRKGLVRQRGRWMRRTLDELGVPATLQNAVRERTGWLSQVGLRIVQAAAVLEDPASEEILAQVAGVSAKESGDAVVDAIEASLLREEREGYAFRHSLASQAVRDALPGPWRRQLHRRAAAVLEKSEPRPLARLAYHYREAGRTSEWVQTAEEAAEWALSVGEDAAAFGLLERALDAPGLTRTTKARLAVRLARAALHALEHAEAIDILRRILDEEPIGSEERGELRLSLGWLLFQAGNAKAAFAEIVHALADLEERPASRARAMSTLAMPWVRDGHLREHLRWMEEAEQEAEKARDPLAKIAVLTDRAYLLAAVGDGSAWDLLEKVRREASSLDERRQLVRGCFNLGYAASWLGHRERARSLAAEGIQLSGDLKEGRVVVGTWDLLAVLWDWWEGRWETLVSRAEELLRQIPESPGFTVDLELVLALHLMATGRPDDAAPRLETVRVRSDAAGVFPVASAASSALARLHLGRGDPAAAIEVASDFLDVARCKGIWTWAAEIAPPLVDAMVSSGRDDGARTVVSDLASGLRGRDAPLGRAALFMCRGLLAKDLGEGKRWMTRASRGLGRLSRPYETAMALERAGRWRLERGDEEGREDVERALEMFRDLGACWDADRARGTLREHGIATPYRGGRKGYGSRLSPREDEVARLAAEGRTNREIAEVLFLSAKTVESHLSSAMRKLGVTSRKNLPMAGRDGEPLSTLESP